MEKESGPDLAGLVLTRVEWGELSPPECEICAITGRENPPRADECPDHGFTPWVATGPGGDGFYAIVKGPKGAIEKARATFATLGEAAGKARRRAALKLVQQALAAERFANEVRTALDSGKTDLVYLGRVPPIPVAESIELIGPPVGVPEGWQQDPVRMLRLCLEQGLCKDPARAAEILGRMSEGRSKGAAS